jgi:hypothetical protein
MTKTVFEQHLHNLPNHYGCCNVIYTLNRNSVGRIDHFQDEQVAFVSSGYSVKKKKKNQFQVNEAVSLLVQLYAIRFFIFIFSFTFFWQEASEIKRKKKGVIEEFITH